MAASEREPWEERSAGLVPAAPVPRVSAVCGQFYPFLGVLCVDECFHDEHRGAISGAGSSTDVADLSPWREFRGENNALVCAMLLGDPAVASVVLIQNSVLASSAVQIQQV